MEPTFTIVEMLNEVVGRIADKGFRIDCQPGLALGFQHVARVEISREEPVGGGGD